LLMVVLEEVLVKMVQVVVEDPEEEEAQATRGQLHHMLMKLIQMATQHRDQSQIIIQTLVDLAVPMVLMVILVMLIPILVTMANGDRLNL